MRNKDVIRRLENLKANKETNDSLRWFEESEKRFETELEASKKRLETMLEASTKRFEMKFEARLE